MARGCITAPNIAIVSFSNIIRKEVKGRKMDRYLKADYGEPRFECCYPIDVNNTPSRLDLCCYEHELHEFRHVGFFTRRNIKW